ncbi:MAG: glutathione S-transferase family protein [Rhizobiaceae bacterium]|nr:glutathione S-transferase family protein [Rhizobiaceae bacterium]MCV0406464.1 glutathione S-transferase family protein [Rhizobiaceae bacterium]
MSIKLYELVGADPTRPFSPHCWKVAMALAHKGLEFESMPTPFTAIAAIEDGGHKTVPVLRDGGTVVSESFEIARYLEETYPERQSLFGGRGGEAATRFINQWAQRAVMAQLLPMILMDVHSTLAPEDQAYFRTSREKRFGKRLEELPQGRDGRLAGLRAGLEPLRAMLALQPYLGGEGPLFGDHIVFGAFQWARIVSPFQVLEADDPVTQWFDRCLDLYGGLGRRVSPARAA